MIDRASTTLEHTNASTFVNGVANSACGAATTISGGGEVPEPETSCSHDTTNASVSHTSESIASTTTGKGSSTSNNYFRRSDVGPGTSSAVQPAAAVGEEQTRTKIPSRGLHHARC